MIRPLRCLATHRLIPHASHLGFSPSSFIDSMQKPTPACRAKSPSPRILRRQNNVTGGSPGKLRPPENAQHLQLRFPDGYRSTSPVLRRRPRSVCTLQRSRSDLSHRYARNSGDYSEICSKLSRASTDLERFFNELGLENAVLEPMLCPGLRSKDSVFFESISTLDTNIDSRSMCSISSRKSNSALSNVDAGDTTPTTPSAGERNERVMRWLCSVRKAHSTSD